MKGAVRVLIVDDEPLARRGVRARLARHDSVEVVGECDNGHSAVRAIASLAPDIVFLDVKMPVLDGFGVVDAVGSSAMPVTVFLTAFDEFALQAFEAQALDYLLKPIDDERFAQALERAWRRVMERRAGAGNQPIRIVTRDRGRILLIDAQEIEWVQAEGDYVRLHLRNGSHLIRETMRAISARLPGRQFVRIHRSTIVNVSQVRELVRHANREFIVVLRDGTRLKLSRGFRDRLQALLPSST
jgi:two-component system LytT family response regulator